MTERSNLFADGEDVRLINPAIDAMRKFQKAMEGAAEEAGWKSDDDVVAFIKEIRAEMEANKSKGDNKS